MSKDFNIYKWRRDHLNENNNNDYGLNENVTPINDLEDVKNFLYNNKEKIFQIDQRKIFCLTIDLKLCFKFARTVFQDLAWQRMRVIMQTLPRSLKK
jgi:hypothetical protein